jgi:hypothetical protein
MILWNKYHLKSFIKLKCSGLTSLSWLKDIPGGFVTVHSNKSQLRAWAVSKSSAIETRKLTLGRANRWVRIPNKGSPVLFI